jgi:hypothetical protein
VFVAFVNPDTIVVSMSSQAEVAALKADLKKAQQKYDVLQ